MASMYGYAYLIVGINVLLLLASATTDIGGFSSMFVGNVTIDPLTHEVSFNDFANLNQFASLFFGSLVSLLGVVAFGIGTAVLLLTKDFSQAFKASLATITTTLIVADFIALMTLHIDGTFGILIKIIGWVLYLPLTIAFFIAVSNWIGGKD